MRIVRTPSVLGSTIATAELESPERAQDHFEVATTSPALAVGAAGNQNGTRAALLVVESKGGDGTHTLQTASDAAFTADVETWTNGAALTNERQLHVAIVRGSYYYRLTRTGGTTDPTVTAVTLAPLRGA